MPLAKREPSRLVLLIGSLPPPYHGSNIYFDQLLHSRLKEEFSLVHLDTSDHRSLDNIERVDIVNIWLGVKNIVQLVWLLIRYRFDLVYVPVAPSFPAFLRDGLFLVLGRWFSKASQVIHLHRRGFRREFYDQQGWIGRWFIRWALKGVDVAIVLGKRLRQAFDGLLPNAEVVVIPNGIKDPVGTLIERPARQDTITYGYLGNLFRTKGIMELLQAFYRVWQRHPAVQLKVAGGWWKKDVRLRDEIAQWMANQGIKGVQFIGVITDDKKDQFLRSIDVLVFPSRDEGFPLVILEAMAYGLPVISSKDEGAIPEVIVDGKTGFLIDPHNIEEIAKAMEWMLLHPQKRIAMGKAARQRFEQEYTMEKNVERIIAVFHQVLSSQTAGKN